MLVGLGAFDLTGGTLRSDATSTYKPLAVTYTPPPVAGSTVAPHPVVLTLTATSGVAAPAQQVQQAAAVANAAVAEAQHLAEEKAKMDAYAAELAAEKAARAAADAAALAPPVVSINWGRVLLWAGIAGVGGFAVWKLVGRRA